MHFGNTSSKWYTFSKNTVYSHYVALLRRDNSDVLRRALDFEVVGKRRGERPNMTWKRQVEERTDQIGLKREDAIARMKWRNGVYELSRSTR